MSVAYGKGAKGRATRLHSLIVRSRGACQSCASPLNLQCAHIVPRGFAWTRTDERNAFCLCASCHHRFTNHVDEWLAFIYKTIGEHAYAELKHKALQGVNVKFNWDNEVLRLRALADELEVAS